MQTIEGLPNGNALAPAARAGFSHQLASSTVSRSVFHNIAASLISVGFWIRASDRFIKMKVNSSTQTEIKIQMAINVALSLGVAIFYYFSVEILIFFSLPQYLAIIIVYLWLRYSYRRTILRTLAPYIRIGLYLFIRGYLDERILGIRS